MKPWLMERSLWVITLVACVAAVGQLAFGSGRSLVREKPLPSMRGVLMYDVAQLMEAADSVAANDPFRMDRHPSRPSLASGPAAPVLAQLQFHLELSGVSGGPPWRAIVSGVPGRDGGVLVSAGDTLGGIRIRAVRRDTLIVQTRDSTMTLTLKR